MILLQSLDISSMGSFHYIICLIKFFVNKFLKVDEFMLYNIIYIILIFFYLYFILFSYVDVFNICKKISFEKY